MESVEWGSLFVKVGYIFLKVEESFSFLQFNQKFKNKELRRTFNLIFLHVQFNSDAVKDTLKT